MLNVIRSLVTLSATTFVVATLLPTRAMADCTEATVTMVLDIGATQCGGKMAFKTTQANKWICTTSEGQGRLVTAAFLSGKRIAFQFSNTNSTCVPTGTENYSHSTRYIYLF